MPAPTCFDEVPGLHTYTKEGGGIETPGTSTFNNHSINIFSVEIKLKARIHKTQ